MAEAKRKILFVEDEERLRNLMEEHLKEAGYEVFTAADGEIGLKILDEKKPDLVILDLILPKKDGFEFLEEMNSQPETKGIPVVIFTNLEEKFDIERAAAYGVRAYLVKANYKPHEVVEKVNKILNASGTATT
ncbi:MAG: response regulator [Candidatus Tagabacteria bacterium CG10_big_fil_rev_8_21_14_0_10_40_13]|uniref:Response regulator n=2 Tax=Candidatus Tagaibacteriota TaxID=1817918 RepID=A0A2M8L8S5_9BACT|nr:MAG: response regulator [Candidatus Tagabacteria bacterium CG10_big_fil_rev_8_21_14_0_10_40_13]